MCDADICGALRPLCFGPMCFTQDSLGHLWPPGKIMTRITVSALLLHVLWICWFIAERYIGTPQSNPDGYAMVGSVLLAAHLCSTRAPFSLIAANWSGLFWLLTVLFLCWRSRCFLGTADDNVFFCHAVKMSHALFLAGFFSHFNDATYLLQVNSTNFCHLLISLTWSPIRSLTHGDLQQINHWISHCFHKHRLYGAVVKFFLRTIG